MIFLGNMELLGKFECEKTHVILTHTLSFLWDFFYLFFIFWFLYLEFILISFSFYLFTYLCLFRGDRQDTRGTAFVVYEDIYDAKNAVDHLSGFNVCGRYLIVLYYQQSRMQKSMDNAAKRKELDKLKEQYDISSKD